MHNRIMKIMMSFILMISMVVSSLFTGINLTPVNAETTESVSSWKELKEIVKTGTDPVVITITEDLIADGTITVPNNKSVTLQADGKKSIYRLDGATPFLSMFKVEAGGTLNLEKGLTLSGKVKTLGIGEKIKSLDQGLDGKKYILIERETDQILTTLEQGETVGPTTYKAHDLMTKEFGPDYLNGSKDFLVKDWKNAIFTLKNGEQDNGKNYYNFINEDGTNRWLVKQNVKRALATENGAFIGLQGTNFFTLTDNGITADKTGKNKILYRYRESGSPDQYVYFADVGTVDGYGRNANKFDMYPLEYQIKDHLYKLDEVTFEDNNWKEGGFFVHNSGGTVNVNGAVFRDFKTDKSFNGVKQVAPIFNGQPVDGSHSTFNMTSGKICNNEVAFVTGSFEDFNKYSYDNLLNEPGRTINTYFKGHKNESAGAIVFRQDSYGTISGDSVIEHNSGGVGALNVYASTVEIKDKVKISYNQGLRLAGAIYINGNNAKVDENNKPISNGTGLGVIVDSADVEIDHNVSWRHGAVTTDGDSQNVGGCFILNNGKIHDNYSYDKGAAIRVASNGVSLNGGEIYNNKARVMGGAIYVNGDSPKHSRTLVINNGSIYKNKAVGLKSEELGGDTDVYFPKGNPDGREGYLQSGCGGGVWTCPFGTLIFDASSVDIYKNKAERVDGGNDFHKDNGLSGALIISKLPNTWVNEENKPLPVGDAKPIEGVVNLTNNTTKDKHEGVQIYGNISRRGGGIGANGTVVFGRFEEETRNQAFLILTKEWEGEAPTNETIYLKFTGIASDGHRTDLGIHELNGKTDAEDENDADGTSETEKWKLTFALPNTITNNNGEEEQLYDPKDPENIGEKCKIEIEEVTKDGKPSNQYEMSTVTELNFVGEEQIVQESQMTNSGGQVLKTKIIFNTFEFGKGIKNKKVDHKPEPTTSKIAVSKKLLGDTDGSLLKIYRNKFAFVLSDQNGDVIETVSNKTPEANYAEFSELVFKKEGDYTYKIKEANVDQLPILVDDKEIEVTFKVENKGGKLVANITKPEGINVVDGIYNVGTFTNVETIDLDVNKQWANIDESAIQNMGNITVQLYKGNEKVENKKVVLNPENGFKGTFGKLPKYDHDGKKIEYSIKELNGENPVENLGDLKIKEYSFEANYKNNADENAHMDHWTITNKLKNESISIDVNKKWLDYDGNIQTDHNNPVTVGLYINDQKVMDSNGNHYVLVLDSSNKYKGEFTNVPKLDANRNEIDYIVKELKVNDVEVTEDTVTIDGVHYSVTNGNKDNGYTITNKVKDKPMEYINLSVMKEWLNSDGSELSDTPESIEVQLYNGDTAVEGKKITLTKTEGFKGEFNGLPKTNEDGSLIHYTVKEVGVDNGKYVVDNGEVKTTYDVSVEETTSGFKIVNKLIDSEKTITNINVKKVWQKYDGTEINEPKSTVEVQLYRNDELLQDQIKQLKSPEYTATFDNLAIKDDDGNEYVYTVKEVKVNDAEVTEDTVTIDGVHYSVTNGNKDNGYTITNKVKDKPMEYIDLSVMKEWLNSDGSELSDTPESIEVQLYTGDTAVEGKKITLTKTEGFKGEFNELPKTNEDGSLIHYTVKEVGEVIDNTITIEDKKYITTDGKLENGYTITNKLIEEPKPQTVNIPVEKQWNDNGMNIEHEEDVVIVLYANDAVYKDADGNDVVLKLNKENGYKGAFIDLPKLNEDGEEIKYEVKETLNEEPLVLVDGHYYETGVSGDVNQFIVTNTRKEYDVTFKKHDINGAGLNGGSFILSKLDEEGRVNEKMFEGQIDSEYTFKLEPGKYEIRELSAPDGYLKAKNIRFVVTIDGTIKVNGEKKDDITMIDKCMDHEVVISKLNPSKSLLKDAKIEISENGKTISKFTTTGNKQQITLKPGTYTFTEIEAPNGFEKIEPFEFIVNVNGSVQIKNGSIDGVSVVNENELNVIDKEIPKQKVKFSKQDIYGNELSGAIIEVYKLDASGNKVSEVSDSWKSDGNIHDFELDPGSYVFVEKEAPNGYEIATEIKFTLQDDGKVKVDDKVLENTDDEHIVMKDNYTSFKHKFSKVDIGGFPVKGAKLKVTEIKPDGSREEIKTWTTDVDENGKPKAEELTLHVGKYEFKEVKAPDGYEVVTEVEFEVTAEKQADGTVVSKIVPKTTVTSGDFVVNDDGSVTVIDDYEAYDIMISKADIDGNEIEGAKIEIHKDGKVIESWTSEKTNHKVNLKPGEYVFKETLAPEGFEVVTDITFSVDKTGKVTVNDKQAEVNKDGVLVVTDDYKVHDIKISKADIDGNEIEGAKILLTDEGGKTIDEWVSKKENHVVKLKPGKYIFKETLAPEGFDVVTDITFTVDKTGKVTVDDKQASVNKDGVLVVTDAYSTKTVSVTVKKKWIGNAANKATIQLLADGNVVDTVDLSTDNKWTHTFKNLFEYDQKTGKKIKYTVKEVKIDGYETDITNGSKNDFEVINTKEQHDVVISKVDLGGTPLVGAKIKVEQLREDKTKLLIESWTTSKYEKTLQLKPGTYVFTEDAAPAGYEVVTSFKFTVGIDGTVKLEKVKVNDVVLTGNKLIITDRNKPTKPEEPNKPKKPHEPGKPIEPDEPEEPKVEKPHRPKPHIPFVEKTPEEIHYEEVVKVVKREFVKIKKILSPLGIPGITCPLGLPSTYDAIYLNRWIGTLIVSVGIAIFNIVKLRQ